MHLSPDESPLTNPLVVILQEENDFTEMLRGLPGAQQAAEPLQQLNESIGELDKLVQAATGDDKAGAESHLIDAALARIDATSSEEEREAFEALRRQRQLMGPAYRQIGQLKGSVHGAEMDLHSYVRQLKMRKCVSARDGTVAWVAEANVDVWERGTTASPSAPPAAALHGASARTANEPPDADHRHLEVVLDSGGGATVPHQTTTVDTLQGVEPAQLPGPAPLPVRTRLPAGFGGWVPPAHVQKSKASAASVEA